MSKSLCYFCEYNCTDRKNKICDSFKGIWCNAEYGRVIKKKIKKCKNYKEKNNEYKCF